MIIQIDMIYLYYLQATPDKLLKQLFKKANKCISNDEIFKRDHDIKTRKQKKMMNNLNKYKRPFLQISANEE